MLDATVVRTAVGPFEYAEHGEGPPALLVHGMPGTWRQLAPLAFDLGDERRVILPSRPGYGRTPATTPAAYGALLDELGIDTVDVVGVSGGAPSAARLAAQQPERVRSLVLCCPLAPHLMKVPAAMRVAFAVPALAAVGARIQRARQRRDLRDEAATDRRIAGDLTPAEQAELARDPAMRDALVGFFLSHLDGPPTVAGFRNDLRSMGFGSGIAPDLEAVVAPTLVIHGDADRVVPMDHARFYASAIAGAELEVLPGAGHAFLLTFRERSLALLRRPRGTPSGGGRAGRAAQPSVPRSEPRPSP